MQSNQFCAVQEAECAVQDTECAVQEAECAVQDTEMCSPNISELSHKSPIKVILLSQ